MVKLMMVGLCAMCLFFFGSCADVGVPVEKMKESAIESVVDDSYTQDSSNSIHFDKGIDGVVVTTGDFSSGKYDLAVRFHNESDVASNAGAWVQLYKRSTFGIESMGNRWVMPGDSSEIVIENAPYGSYYVQVNNDEGYRWRGHLFIMTGKK